jgi:hypothetical protein
MHAIIKQHIFEGPGHSYIMAFDNISDGRDTRMALIAHFEGDSYRNHNVEDAYSSLEGIHYEGERKGFNFDKLVEKHNKAFMELSCNGESVLETKRVHNFIARINTPKLAAAKQQVKATPALLANFHEAANFIVLSVTPLKIADREIGAVDAKIVTTIQAGTKSTMSPLMQITNYGRGLRGRGHARGFFYDLYGRGHGSGRGRGHINSFRLPTTYYTPAEWAKISPAQRSNILTARGTKHNISAIETEYPDMDYDDAFAPEYSVDHHTFISTDDYVLHMHNQEKCKW